MMSGLRLKRSGAHKVYLHCFASLDGDNARHSYMCTMQQEIITRQLLRRLFGLFFAPQRLYAKHEPWEDDPVSGTVDLELNGVRAVAVVCSARLPHTAACNE